MASTLAESFLADLEDLSEEEEEELPQEEAGHNEDVSALEIKYDWSALKLVFLYCSLIISFHFVCFTFYRS